MAKNETNLRVKPTAKALPKEAPGKAPALNRPTKGQTSSDRYSRALASCPLSVWNADLSEVKRSLDRLRRQGKQDIPQFLSSHPEQVLSIIMKVNVRWVNDATLKLFNVQSIDQLRRGLKKSLIKESYELCREGLTLLAEGKTEFSMDALAVKSGGERLYLLLNLSVQKGSEQALSDVFIYCTDISGLKRRKAELRESEEKYRRIFENSPFAKFVADTETGIILNVSARAAELIGRPADEIIGMHFTEIHPQESVKEYRSLFRKHVTEREFVSEGLLLKCGDGKKVSVQIHSAVIDLPERQIITGIFKPFSMAEGRTSIPPAPDYLYDLSDREKEILVLIAWGLTNRQIAKRLFISYKTVETHRYRIMKKLNVHKSVDLVRHVLLKGLLRSGRLDRQIS